LGDAMANSRPASAKISFSNAAVRPRKSAERPASRTGSTCMPLCARRRDMEQRRDIEGRGMEERDMRDVSLGM
jgi:hypothetical protein